MAINDEGRQVQIADQLSETVRSLAHSTRNVPAPADSYALLGNLSASIWSLGQVADQLGRWHANAAEASDERRECENAETYLRTAADLLRNAGEQLDQAHAENGRIRWLS